MEAAVQIAATGPRNIHRQGENPPEQPAMALEFDQRIA